VQGRRGLRLEKLGEIQQSGLGWKGSCQRCRSNVRVKGEVGIKEPPARYVYKADLFKN
jgi:hypothetical protein